MPQLGVKWEVGTKPVQPSTMAFVYAGLGVNEGSMQARQAVFPAQGFVC